MENVTEYYHSKDGGILVWMYVEKDRWNKRCILMGPGRTALVLKQEK